MSERETLILAPGLLCDDYTFAEQKKALEGEYDIAIPSFYDCDSIEAMADRVLAAAKGPFSLAGFSMGGRVSFQVWRKAPERVKRLALMDTGAHPKSDAEVPGREALIRLGHEKGMQALCDQWLPPMVHPDRLKDESIMKPLTDMVLRASADVHERQIRALLGRPDARPLLPTITCPTLVLVGRQDAWSNVASHEEMMTHLPNAELVVIEDSGHFAPVEQPEAVTAALRAWMRRAA